MRTTSSAPSTVVTALSAVLAVTVVLVVGPAALAEHAEHAVRALTHRYGTTWVAAAGVVALAVVLVRRAQPRRGARGTAPAIVPTPTHRPDGRPRLTLVRAEAQS
ncbi:hypothetical protein GON03_09640 [Nocardioides sp. MAH-18]|uniref:Uncharacterized protein n=1 Tax=Nocardioides agri TaxID=2682843 RepID=A0A6L6XQ73_9ACTN|nr:MULTISPECIES: hypothetical protein [unclassified Nocardioides]MBA2954586.1 hypothetical protein [Nocardioides sp. CGMCC 1.13656]MVQ49444.1 hypothetical protein [Nocardioides sp. MAH-18]